MSAPSITVLMAVYNGQAYLKTAIESVLFQSFRDFELLIIDDCSRDDSRKIIGSFSDDRIVLQSNEANLGQTRSLNLGLRMARGEFIARMDADDLAFQDWLKEGTSFLRAQGQSCALVSPLAVIIDGGNKVHKTLNTPRTLPEIIIRSLWASPVNHVGTLMRRTAVLEQGGYDEAYRIAADYALWSKFLRNGFALAVLPRPLVAIRSHARSVTAMAAGKTDIAEVSRIMKENISHWVGLDLTQEEATLLWHLIYNVEGLTVGQMASGYDVFCRVRSGFLDRGRCAAGIAGRSFMRQARTVFMKKVFDCINRRDAVQLRSVTRLYMDRHGYCHIFAFIWAFSYVPFMLFLMPALYIQYRRLKTYRRTS